MQGLIMSRNRSSSIILVSSGRNYYFHWYKYYRMCPKHNKGYKKSVHTGVSRGTSVGRPTYMLTTMPKHVLEQVLS